MMKVALTFFFGIAFAAVSIATADANESSTESAMTSIFDPSRAPERRTMGLLQRNFLDLVEEANPRLEIALVIDGTDSMDSALEGVRNAMNQMVQDLRRYRDNIKLQIVVYRDIGSPSGEVALPLNISNNDFTPNLDLVREALDSIKPESGKPFFHELVDLGLYEAITKLNWSEDDTTTRWILLFGDAPPLDEQWSDEKTNSKRRYSTKRLITKAREKDIRISSLLCESKSQVESAYKASLDETRQFMTRLANETNGLVLDLSYDNIRNSIANASKKPRNDYHEIAMDPISKAEVQQLRDLADINKLVIAPGGQTRIAILPYMPLQQMSFKSDLPQVQFASELRYKFRQIPTVKVKSPWQVENAVAMCRDKISSKKDFLNAVAARLRVDYVLWGDINPLAGQQVSVSPVLFRRDTGQLTAFKALDIEEHMVPTGRIASGLLKRIVTGDPEMLAALDRQSSQLLRPVALKSSASADLMGAYDAMENALQFLVGSPESNKLFQQADRQLNRTLKDDPQNPLAHYLLANLKFNQAQAAAKRVDKDEAVEAMKQFKRSLEQANRFRNRGKENLPKELALEIAGMYQLLIKKDTKLAIETFESIAETSADSTLFFSRRAHWMLAGIFAGDWNVSEDVVDVAKMRKHLIHILAMHEDSPEAANIRKWLRWDTKSGGTQFKYFPKANQTVLEFADDV